jgi:hypothetical protein
MKNREREGEEYPVLFPSEKKERKERKKKRRKRRR